jgi:hypothetical protein
LGHQLLFTSLVRHRLSRIFLLAVCVCASRAPKFAAKQAKSMPDFKIAWPERSLDADSPRMSALRVNDIARVSSDISYTTFHARFLRPLQPCLITGLAETWPATRNWTCRDPLVPKFAALKAAFGDVAACITFCDQLDGNGDPIQRDMSVCEFIDAVLTAPGKRYLKDFHFCHHLPPPYSVPEFFQGSLPQDTG